MAQTGFTPISLYYTTTASAAPTAGNLVAGELAINTTDGKLYYKDTAGVVKLLASNAGSAGDVVGPSSATDNGVALFDGTTGKLIKNSSSFVQTATGVGIGTTSPAGKLDVAQGNSYVSTFLNSTGAYAWYFNKSRGTTVGTNTIVASGDTLGGTIYNGADGTGYIEAGKILAQVDGTPGTNDMPGRLLFYTTADGASSSTERMRLDSSGNLGLGVTPSAWTTGFRTFQLGEGAYLSGRYGTASPKDELYLGVNNYNDGTNWVYANTAASTQYYQDAGTHVWRYAASGTAGATITWSTGMTLNASGNLGIGTTSPDVPLSVVGRIKSSVSFLSSDGSVSEPGYRFTSDADSGIYMPSVGNIGLVTAGAERMRIDSSGNLGLGVTPSVWTGLGVAIETLGGALIGQGTNNITLFQNTYYSSGFFKYKTTGSAASNYYQQSGAHVWSNAPSGTAGAAITFTERMRIDSSGNVLIGKTSATANGGDLQVSSGITFPATQVAKSDANTLDDYEEGTFTPVVIGTSVAGTGTYTTQVGSYTKIGNTVTVSVAIVYTGHTGTGNIRISGLPFTSLTATSREWVSLPEFTNMTMPASTIPFAYVSSNASFVALASMAVGSGTTTALAIDAAAGIFLSLTYQTA